MGFFRTKVKQGRIYSMAEAINILNQKGYEGYTTKEVGDGKCEIITIAESRVLERKMREKQEFYSSLNGGGSYQKQIEKQPPKYGDWGANAKKYNSREFVR
ncbi:MAG: hypothetical protein HFJ34_01670 [Clostridia bacterium]|nr:hypothetical protein [Clostridia bacterium]